MFERAVQAASVERTLFWHGGRAGAGDRGTYPPFRTLRRALLVGELHHLTRAAELLDRSQSAVTRGILELERFLGCPLFERRATGMVGTREAAVLFPRVRAALDVLAAAERKLRALSPAGGTARRAQRILQLDVANACVLALVAVFDHGDVARAADALGIAPKSVRKSIGALERRVGARLFERTATGAVVPTEAGRILAIHLKRALAEIRAGVDELRRRDGRIAGSLGLGVTPTAASLVVPRAIRVLRARHPDVAVAVHAADEAVLETALGCGDLDLVVGTLERDRCASAEIVTTTLMKDRVEVVVRASHPLARTGDVPLRQLLSLDWILPPKGSPLRDWFSAVLAGKGLREPTPVIETASLTVLRGALLEGDCVALVTRLQCWHELVEHGLFDALPISALSRPRVERPLHLHVARRAGARPSPAAEALAEILADIAASLDDDRLAAEWTRATA